MFRMDRAAGSGSLALASATSVALRGPILGAFSVEDSAIVRLAMGSLLGALLLGALLVLPLVGLLLIGLLLITAGCGPPN
ncbi:MAG TPA: hypothetical protein VFK02_16975 [Kofleriaceae bacterium]|nr:hypothetical protein [Kofleriaceae bacterium]